MKIERPMLAATVSYDDLEKVEWPVLCSPKVDGIRCLIHPELGPVTRSFKPLPNKHVWKLLTRYAGLSNLDGELVKVDVAGHVAPFNETQSAVMTQSGQPLFMFLAFDCFDRPEWDFVSRHLQAEQHCKKIGNEHVTLLKHSSCKDIEGFVKFTDRCIQEGYEGSIIRAPAGPYKNGRSTLRQGFLLKYKQWADAEGTIVGFEELYHNANPDQRNNFDLAKRSSHKDNMQPMDTLGALVVQTAWGELRVGTGFDQATRKVIWDRNQFFEGRTDPVAFKNTNDIGRVITFKYQPHGMQDLPRFPVFKGFREGS